MRDQSRSKSTTTQNTKSDRNFTLLKCATWTISSSSAKSSSSFGISSMRYSLVAAFVILMHSSWASSFCTLNILFEIISTSLHNQHNFTIHSLWRNQSILFTVSLQFHIMNNVTANTAAKHSPSIVVGRSLMAKPQLNSSYRQWKELCYLYIFIMFQLVQWYNYVFDSNQ